MQWWERMVSWNGSVKQDFYMKVIMDKVNACVVDMA